MNGVPGTKHGEWYNFNRLYVEYSGSARSS
jgi:hypothetical protein